MAEPDDLVPVPERVSFGEALRVWARIGLLSFGGPAGQIATMHRELVEKRRWIDDARFFHALSYCTLLPGPEAMQLATYVGWMLHRTPGALAAGTLFVLPGFVALLALSIAYATLGDLGWVVGLFFGLKCAVLAMVVDAARRIGQRVLRAPALVAIAALAFVALFVFDVPFPLVVIGAGVLGLALPARLVPPLAGHGDARAAQSLIDRMEARGELTHTHPSTRRAAIVLATGSALWALPFLLALATRPSPVFLDEATFFSETALVTFGGAYAVLAYVAQRAVHDFGWLAPGEMVDGLALAETTPGPLIIVVELVGFLGAYRQPGGLSPLVAGTLGAMVTVWVTFVPCFLWILLGGPYVETLRSNRHLGRALTAITAAVVGVIANLSIWFAVHVLFGQTHALALGPASLVVPELASVDVTALVLSALAILTILRTKIGPLRMLAGAAAAGLVLRGLLGA